VAYKKTSATPRIAALDIMGLLKKKGAEIG